MQLLYRLSSDLVPAASANTNFLFYTVHIRSVLFLWPSTWGSQKQQLAELVHYGYYVLLLVRGVCEPVKVRQRKSKQEEQNRERGGTDWHSQEANISDSILLCLQTELDFNPMRSVPRGGKLTICLFIWWLLSSWRFPAPAPNLNVNQNVAVRHSRASCLQLKRFVLCTEFSFWPCFSILLFVFYS